MTYLVTLNPGTDYEKTRVVSDDDLPTVVRNSFPPYGRLADGQAIQYRRADYLDIKGGVVVTGRFADGSKEIERPVGYLRLIEGGKDGEQEGRDHGCQDPYCSCSV